MADRTNKLPVRGSGVQSFPSIQISMGAARSFQGVAQTLGRIGEGLEDELDRRAVIEAKREGTVAGATGVPEMREDETTLRGASFNEAARMSYANRIEIASREHLAQLQVQHATDPAGFEKASKAYMFGMLQEVNQVDPALGAIFSQTYQMRAATSFSKVKAAHSAKVKTDLRGTVVRLQDVLTNEVQGFAGDLLSSETAASTNAFMNFSVARDRLRIAMMQTAPNGTPIYTAEQREKALIKFEDEFLEAAGRGFIDNAPNKLLALSHLSKEGGKININIKDDDGKVVQRKFDLLSNMSSDQRRSMLSYAREMANLEQRKIVADEARARRQRAELEKSTSKDMVDALVEGALTPKLVEDGKGNMTPSDYLFYSKLAKGGGGIVDEGNEVQEMETAIRHARATGDFQAASDLAKELTDAGRLTVGSYGDYEKRIASFEDKDNPKSTYHRNQDYLRNLSDAAESMGSKFSGIALAMPRLSRDFDRWWDTFTDPKTGEARNPTDDEADAKILSLAQRAFPRRGIEQIERDMLDVRIPPMNVVIGEARSPGAVRGDDGAVVVKETADNYFRAYGVTAGTPVDQWPAELKRLLADLDAYDKAVRDMRELIGLAHGDR